MNWTGVNFAGNDTINITLQGCQQNMGSSLKASVNDGAFVAFDSNCFIKDYNATGNLNSANVTIQFLAGNLTNPFYTPLVIGNISFDSKNSGIAPNITINIPTNNTFTSDTSQDINFTVSDTNLNTCWYSNDTYTTNTTLTNCNTNITTLNWAEGQHNVTVYANDTQNNVNSSRITFTIDTTNPTISFVNPTTNSSTLYQGSIFANLSFSDTNLGTANIYLFNNFGNTFNSTAGTASTLFINFTGLADGTYYLNATVNDSANNKNYTETRTINVNINLTAGIWKDLSTKDTGDWVGTTNFNDVFGIAVNPNNNLVYTGLGAGKFGVYNHSNGVWMDLSGNDTYPETIDWIGTTNIRAIAVNPNDNLVYTVVKRGKLG